MASFHADTIEQELVQHLNVLYGDDHSMPQRFTEANKFLTEFRRSSQAWNVCLHFIASTTQPNNAQMLTFAAQTVYDNVLANWQTIDATQRAYIVQTLQRFIAQFSQEYLRQYLQAKSTQHAQHFRFILNKTISTIAFLALNGNQANDMMQSVVNQCLAVPLPQQLASFWVHLETLNAFALEFEQQHVSPSILSQTRDFLSTKHRDTLLRVVLRAIQTAQQCQPILYKLLSLAFSSLKHWINIVDISLERMQSVGLLDEVLRAIVCLYQTADHSDAKQFMVESMTQITNKGMLNRDDRKEYEQILHKICVTLHALQPALQNAIDAQHLDTVRSLCHLVCAFCEAEAQYIAKGAQEVCLRLVDMILQFTSHASTMVTTETFGFWSRLQDIGMSDRHPSLQKDVFVQLLRALLAHSTDPQEFDQHSRFRSNSSEIFISIYFTLQAQYFVEIETRLKSLLSNDDSTTTTATSDLLRLVRIESCIFALSVIAQEVYDERDDATVQRMLEQHIKPICGVLFECQLHVHAINAHSLHLLHEICHFFRGYAFYICRHSTQLLQQCLVYSIELPCKAHTAVMLYECSHTFNKLLFHALPIWMQQVDVFEQIVRSVQRQIGDGQRFYRELKPHEIELLEDISVVDTAQCDETVFDAVTRQQSGAAMFYESVCCIIDAYNDRKRQSALVHTLVEPFLQKCRVILETINVNEQNNGATNASQMKTRFHELVGNLRIFAAFLRGLKTTDTSTHPLLTQTPQMLAICQACITQIPAALNTVAMEEELHGEMLYDAVCGVMECVLQIFGSSTSSMAQELVSMCVQILKRTHSESAAHVLQKMVTTFTGSAQHAPLAEHFIKVIHDALTYFHRDEHCDVAECHKAVHYILECVVIQTGCYRQVRTVWTLLVPECLALALKILTRIQDRDGLKNTLNILKQIFDAQNAECLSGIFTELLQQSLLPNLIRVLFEGIALHFERMIASKAYDVYFNLMQWKPDYIEQETIASLNKLPLPIFQNNENKKMFMAAFSAQKSNERKFLLVLSTFYSVCHSFNTPDSFGAMIA